MFASDFCTLLRTCLQLCLTQEFARLCHLLRRSGQSGHQALLLHL